MRAFGVLFLCLAVIQAEVVGSSAVAATDETAAEDNSTTTTPATTQIDDKCSCGDTVVYAADETEGVVKTRQLPTKCGNLHCPVIIKEDPNSTLTLFWSVMHKNEVFYYKNSTEREDMILFVDGRTYEGHIVVEGYGLFLNISEPEYIYEPIFKFSRRPRGHSLCPQPFVEVTATPRILHRTNFSTQSCAFRLTSPHPIHVLTRCNPGQLRFELNMKNSSSAYKTIVTTKEVETFELPSTVEMSVRRDTYYDNSCEITVVALNYDPCNCSSSNYNLTVEEPLHLKSPGYPNLMCANLKCNYTLSTAQKPPKGMMNAFHVATLHKPQTMADRLMLSVDKDPVASLSIQSTNHNDIGIYIGDTLEVDYAASFIFSDDHGFELVVVAIIMPEDCRCPTHKPKELSDTGIFQLSIPEHCPRMLCRFVIPNSQLGEDRIFRLSLDYHLPHEGERIDFNAGDMHHIFSSPEDLQEIRSHAKYDFVTNSTVEINYKRQRIFKDTSKNGPSNFTLEWTWVTENECKCKNDMVFAATIDHWSPSYSPNYPLPYCTNMKCTYKILAPEGYHVEMNVTEFSTEPHADFVYFFEGFDTNSFQYLRKMAGSRRNSTVIETKSNKASVLFISDGSVIEKGFKILYRAVANPQVPIVTQPISIGWIFLVVMIVVLTIGAVLYLAYKKPFCFRRTQTLVGQVIENPVYSFSAVDDVVVVVEKD